MREVFIVNCYGLVQKITNICICDRCKERGMLEFEVVDLEGKFVDYIKFNKLDSFIKNISYTTSGLTHKNNLYEIIAKMLQKKLLEIEEDEE